MSKLLELINTLLIKAGHPNTPVNEASSCALKAAKLIYQNQNNEKEKNKIKIVETINSSQKQYVERDSQDIDLSNQDLEWHEVKPFNTVIIKSNDTCKKCFKPINKGEIVARVIGEGFTHHRCRHYWTENRS